MNNEHLLSNSLCPLVYQFLFRLLMNVVILVFIEIPYFCFPPSLSWRIWQLNKNNDSFIFSSSKLTMTFEYQLLSLSITITSWCYCLNSDNSLLFNYFSLGIPTCEFSYGLNYGDTYFYARNNVEKNLKILKMHVCLKLC